jgi:hypothetical protein
MFSEFSVLFSDCQNFLTSPSTGGGTRNLHLSPPIFRTPVSLHPPVPTPALPPSPLSSAAYSPPLALRATVPRVSLRPAPLLLLSVSPAEILSRKLRDICGLRNVVRSFSECLPPRSAAVLYCCRRSAWVAEFLLSQPRCPEWHGDMAALLKSGGALGMRRSLSFPPPLKGRWKWEMRQELL